MKVMKTMKYLTLILTTLLAFAITGCDDDDTLVKEGDDPEVTYSSEGETTFAVSEGILFNNSSQLGNGDQNFVYTGKDYTIKKGVYTLVGWVYLAKGSKLTIEPGTIIKGDKKTMASLIVEPGAQLIAKGDKNNPIIFTSAEPKGSRKPGDWGGLIICGNAKNNLKNQQIEGGPRTKHGGDNDDDNSGIYSYIRVEFAGYPFQKDKEINAITFGSVGRGTTVDHIQVSYSNDDSYEWFGGSVNCKNLVAYKGWDDDFDTDNGFSGHIQYCLSIRDPKIADVSQSNGFESDNCADGNSTASPLTSCVFSNVTFIGPATEKNKTAGFNNDASYINGGNMYPNNNSGLGKFQSAMQIRRSSRLNCFNSVAVGYPIGLIIDGEKGNSVESAKEGHITLQNIFFAGMDAIGTDANKEYRDILGTYEGGKITFDETKESFSSTFFKSQPGNKVFTEAELNLIASNGIDQNYLPGTGSPLLNAASFENVTSSFIDKTVTYIGAFSGASDNWLEGWTNFDPQNADY